MGTNKTGGGAAASPLLKARLGFCAFGQGVIYWAAAVVIAFVAVNSLLFTSYISPSYDEVILYRWDWFPLSLLFCAALVLFVSFAFSRNWQVKISIKWLKRLLLAYTLLFGAAWVLLVRSAPVDDAAIVLDTARSFINGDYSALEAYGYMGVYPFQLGLAFYFELALRLFGQQNFIALQLLNVLWAALAYQTLVEIAALLFENDSKVPMLLCFVLFFCWPPLLYSTFVYGVLPGLACALLALRFTLAYLKQRRGWQLPVAILFAALANLLKNNYLIFAAGIFVVLLLDLLRRGLKNGGWKQALCLAALVLFTLGAHAPVQWMYAARSGLPTQQGMPRNLWVAMALRPSERAPGWYNEISLHLYETSGYDREAAAKEGNRVIRQSFEDFGRDPAYAAEFFYKKAVSQWNEPSYASLWVSHFDAPHQRRLPALVQSIYEGPLNTLVLGEMNLVHLMCYAFALVCLLVRRKTFSLPQLLPALILLGGFVFHMAWEAKSQYILPYYVLMLPYSVAGLADAAQWARRRVAALRAQKGAGK